VPKSIPPAHAWAGVEDESRSELTDRGPELLDRLQPASHRLVPPGCVLDQDRERKAALLALPLEDLPPVVEADRLVVVGLDVTAVHDQTLGADPRRGPCVRAQQLPARDPDPVVRRGHVEDVRSMDVDVEIAGGELLGSWVGARSLPALRVGHEDLYRISV
jgi:hypothetical protein